MAVGATVVGYALRPKGWRMRRGSLWVCSGACPRLRTHRPQPEAAATEAQWRVCSLQPPIFWLFFKGHKTGCRPTPTAVVDLRQLMLVPG
ncbi:MAG: hypothetical protein EAY75_16315 [Bacteroidetes bacterium]|nr:MAG: hypothetical protein EAY75_16315 [Bacteroidota bacterium]